MSIICIEMDFDFHFIFYSCARFFFAFIILLYFEVVVVAWVFFPATAKFHCFDMASIKLHLVFHRLIEAPTSKLYETLLLWMCQTNEEALPRFLNQSGHTGTNTFTVDSSICLSLHLVCFVNVQSID